MSENWSHIKVDHVPEGHIITGHVTVMKVLDSEGNAYWATRSMDLNDMEAYGMMMNAVRLAERDLVDWTRPPNE
jgi:hypothetical protein